MNNSQITQQEYLTVADVQQWLNISQGTAYGLTHRTDFPVCRFGSTIRIPRVPFLAWVEENTSNPKHYGASIL